MGFPPIAKYVTLRTIVVFIGVYATMKIFGRPETKRHTIVIARLGNFKDDVKKQSMNSTLKN